MLESSLDQNSITTTFAPFNPEKLVCDDTEKVLPSSYLGYGVSLNAINFNDFRSKTTALSYTPYSYVSTKIFDANQLIIQNDSGTFLYKTEEDKLTPIYTKKNPYISNLYLFPTFHKVAFVAVQSAVNPIPGENSQRKFLMVYDTLENKIVYQSDQLSEKIYIGCTYYAQLESLGRMVCAFNDPKNDKSFIPTIFDIRDFKTTALKFEVPDYDLSTQWPTYNELQSYSELFIMKKSNRILTRGYNRKDSKNSYFFISETGATEVDTSLTYDYLEDGTAVTFADFKTAVDNETNAYDYNQICNGVDYSDASYDAYFQTWENDKVKNKIILCFADSAVMYRQPNTLQKCTSLSQCSDIIQTMGSLPLNIGYQSTYLAGTNRIYSSTTVNNNYIATFFAQISLSDLKSKIIDLGKSGRELSLNNFAKESVAIISDEVRLFEDTLVQGFKIYDSELNKTFEVPVIKGSADSYFYWRDRKVVNGTVFYVGSMYNPERIFVFDTKLNSVTKIDGSMLYDANKLYFQNDSPLFYFSDVAHNKFFTYNLSSGETALFHDFGIDTINSYGTSENSIAFSLYSEGQSNFEIFDRNTKNSLFRKQYGNLNGVILSSVGMDGVLFAGKDFGSTEDALYLFKYNFASNSISQTTQCSPNSYSCYPTLSNDKDGNLFITLRDTRKIYDKDLNLLIDAHESGILMNEKNYYSTRSQSQIYIQKYFNDPEDNYISSANLSAYDLKDKTIKSIEENPITGNTATYEIIENSTIVKMAKSQRNLNNYDLLEYSSPGLEKLQFNNVAAANPYANVNTQYVVQKFNGYYKYSLFEPITLNIFSQFEIPNLLMFPSAAWENMVFWQIQDANGCDREYFYGPPPH